MTGSPTRPAGKARRRDVERSLKAVLRSEHFASSEQLADFLTFIVNKTLDGEEEDIKAYTIAVDALGRPEDFDPQTNAAVRVAAGRLRQALALHNAETPPDGIPVQINLEPGSYVPNFTHIGSPDDEADQAEGKDDGANIEDPQPGRGPEGLVSAADPAVVAVDHESPLPVSPKAAGPQTGSRQHIGWLSLLAVSIFAGLIAVTYIWSFPGQEPPPSPPSDVRADRLPDTRQSPIPPEIPSKIDANLRPRIIATIMLPDAPYPAWYKPGETVASLEVVAGRFDDYQFLGARPRDAVPMNDPRVADYHLWVTVYSKGQQIRTFGKLVREVDGTVLWSAEQIFGRPGDPGGRNVLDMIGRAYAPLASPYGVIHTDLLRRGRLRGRLDCVVAAYEYFYHETDAGHARARRCGERLVERGSSLPSIHATLTFLYLDEYRENRNRRARDPLDAAEEMALRAIALGPLSARAHQAMFAVHKVRGNREEARAEAEKAVALNPYDTDIMSDYAAWLISVGDFEKGRQLINRAAEMLDVRPAWLEFYRFLAAELSNDFEAADQVEGLMDIGRSPLMALAVTLASHRRGETQKTKQALDKLMRTDRAFVSDPMKGLLNRGFDERVARDLVSRLEAAGLPTKN